MRNFYVFILLFLFSIVFVQAQLVTVKDGATKAALVGVAVYDTTYQTTTDLNGAFDISKFESKDILHFQMLGYRFKEVNYSQIIANNYIVYLDVEDVMMEEVVVSFSGWEEKAKTIPHQISRITAEDVSFQNVQTAADMVGSNQQVFIQKSQLGGGSPMIRGFAANRVLLVVDGVRMNNAIFRSGNLQNIITLDPNNTESAEVIFGTGSVIYGSDAIGGVLNFSNKTAPFTNDKKIKFDGNSIFRYSSANRERTIASSFQFANQYFSSYTSFNFGNYDHLIMGNVGNPSYQRLEYVTQNGSLEDSVVLNHNPNKQLFTAYEQDNFYQNFKLRSKNTKWLADYGFYYSTTSDIPRYDRLIQKQNDSFRYAEWYYGPQKWMMNRLKLVYNGGHKLFDKGKLNVAYQNFEESRNDRRFGSSNLRSRTENVAAISANIDFLKYLNNDSKIFYGIEYIHNKVASIGEISNATGEQIPIASRYPDGATWQSAAAYVSTNLQVNEQVNITAGIRYNYILLQANFDSEFYLFPFTEANLNNGSLTGNLGLVYRPTGRLQINTNISSGFRAPNVDDVGKIFDSEPGNVVVPNPNLQPEYAYTFDFGIKQSLLNNKLSWQFDTYYTWLSNAIVRNEFTINEQDSIFYDGELSNVQALVNTDAAHVWGLSGLVQYDFIKNWQLSSTLTYTRGVARNNVIDATEPLRHAAPLFGNISLMYQTKKLMASVYAVFNGEIAFENLAPSEINKPHIYAQDFNGNPYSPSWFTLNLKAQYKLFKTTTIGIGVENILNHRYRPYSSGIVAPGRNFIISLRT